MKRSVIQLAGRTLLVSLPAKWAAANNVKKGDELDLVEDSHKIVINAGANSKIETVNLNADSLGSLQLVRRYVFALYKRGIDEIHVTYSDPKIVDAIRDTILNETVGYEIVSQTPKSCVVKYITSGGITEFDNLLRRIFLLLLSMSEDVLTAIKSKDFSHLQKVALLEKTNNRLTTICRRSLNKIGTDTYSKVGPIYYIIEELENFVDEYSHICNNLSRLHDKSKEVRSEVLNILETVNEMARSFYEIFYKFDAAKYNSLWNLRTEYINKAHDLVENKKLTPAEFYIAHHGIIMIDKIFCMMGPFLVLMSSKN